MCYEGTSETTNQFSPWIPNYYFFLFSNKEIYYVYSDLWIFGVNLGVGMQWFLECDFWQVSKLIHSFPA